MTRNLCCTFPHGDAVVLPLILTSMGLAATLMTFGLFPLVNTGDVTYGCLEYEIPNNNAGNSNNIFQDTVRENKCFDLLLNHPSYWDENEVTGDTGWSAGIQAGTVFGIFACVLGTVAWGLLVSATCLEIKSRRLMAIRALLSFASLFALLTIVAVSADVCEALFGGDRVMQQCDRKGFRIGFGGAAMMAGFILHLFALVATMGFGPVEKTSGDTPTMERQESAPLDIENTA